MSEIHITQFNEEDNQRYEKARKLCRKFNAAEKDDEKHYLLSQMFKRIGERLIVIPPFTIDTIDNTIIGHNCFINRDCKFLDFGGLIIGNNVGISMNVTIITNGHPCNPLTLDHWIDLKEPVIIEDDVWIGANTIILGNITIGKGAIIGAGSVVTKNIPAGEVWAGNPAKYIETVTEYQTKFKNKAVK